MAAPRRRKMVAHRRRVEDEDGEEGGPDQFDLDDDSLTEGSLASDDHDPADDSDTSNIDEASPTTPAIKKTNARARNGHGNGSAKVADKSKAPGGPAPEPSAEAAKPSQVTTTSDTDFMLNGLAISDAPEPVKELDFEDLDAPQSPSKSSGPLVVSSSAAMDQLQQGVPQERRRREHDEYRRKRDEDPAFVPNRGAFFMHDHRHAGPSANGFRPFGRGGRGGRGRGAGIGGPFAPFRYVGMDQQDHLHISR